MYPCSNLSTGGPIDVVGAIWEIPCFGSQNRLRVACPGEISLDEQRARSARRCSVHPIGQSERRTSIQGTPKESFGLLSGLSLESQPTAPNLRPIEKESGQYAELLMMWRWLDFRGSACLG